MAGSVCHMCGRYASTRSAADLSALFEADDETDGALVADYNVAPTDPVAIVRHTARTRQRVVSVARWGLVPPWSKDAQRRGAHDQRAGRDRRHLDGRSRSPSSGAGASCRPTAGTSGSSHPGRPAGGRGGRPSSRTS